MMKRAFILATFTLLAAALPKRAAAETWLKKFGREYSAIDTNYVEPHNYNFAVMLSGTYKDGGYRLTDETGHKLVLREDHTFKIGPYVGYKWFFIGYQWDAFKGSNKDNSELSFDFYLPIGGITFYRRKNTSRYTLYGVKYTGSGGKEDYSSQVNGTEFDGMETSITGLDLYYVFNHKKYSMRAAYSQTTRQIRSAGSWMAGLGYNKQKIYMDYDALRETLRDKIGDDADKVVSDTRETSSISYRYLSLQGGYGYNWVFAKNWLFNASLTLALGYVHYLKVNINGDDYLDKLNLTTFNKLKVDGTVRFGLVWNNSVIYAGMATILHGYTFDIKTIQLLYGYGTANVYVGYNFNLFKKKNKSRKKK